MALREIRVEGDPILNKECKPVKEMTERVAELIDDMFDTMYEGNGCGLAANQVGILKQIIVMDIEDGEQYVLINPEILETEGEVAEYEGCLSVPGMRGKVTRPERVKVRALNEDFEPIEIEADGLLSRCIQHEIDHLHGHLYTERVEGRLYRNDEEIEDEDETGDSAGTAGGEGLETA